MDKVFFSARYYIKPRSSEEHEHLVHYVKLRRLELLVNHGNYLGQELQVIRKAAAIGADSEIRKAALDLGPPKTWLTIADELAGTDMNDLRKNVWIACGVLGIDPNHMVWPIKERAERNRSFYNQIRLYISDCHWVSVAEQVYRDLVVLPNVAPDADTAANYEKVLRSIQNENFDAMSRDDPHHWFRIRKARS